MKILTRIALAVFLSLFIVACDGDGDEEIPRFEQNFESPVGAVSADRGNSPVSMATAYLINAQEGYFLTADHFIDVPRLLYTNELNLFVNGRVYTATPVKVLQLYDLAVVRITDDFDPQDLSEPFELADDTVAVNNTVYARGVHPHPADLREKNRDRGEAGGIAYIMRDYYKRYFPGDSTQSEFVYDNLQARVISVNKQARINYSSSGAVTDRIQEARHQSNRYFYIDTGYNHIISFGGLSGGPVVNQDNKLVGIITAEKPRRQYYGRGKTVYDRITVTYIDLVRDEIAEYFEN